MARRPALMNERGFTLAELLVASAVLALLLLGIITIQQQGLKTYQIGAARVEVQQNARAALETMSNDIRTAQTITAVGAGCGTGPVPTGGGATTISITDQNGTAIQYQMVGTELQRNGTGLSGGVQNLRIWCYDENAALTATSSLVRSVHVQVRTRTEAQVTAGSDRDQQAFMEARVRLRNF
jgi:prepilin-type N-terminal cleavage/methylation domain-containing protein